MTLYKIMFEKEAEERARKLEESQTLGIYDNDEDYARDSGWNEGEVAGYEEGFKDGADFAYTKANEWRYPSKGELPNSTGKVLICYGREDHMKFVWWREDFGTFGNALPVEITAWRYIEPPKEEE